MMERTPILSIGEIKSREEWVKSHRHPSTHDRIKVDCNLSEKLGVCGIYYLVLKRGASSTLTVENFHFFLTELNI